MTTIVTDVRADAKPSSDNIARQLDEAAAAERAIRDAHKAIPGAEGFRRAAAWQHLYELQRIECEKFARSRGWRVYKGRQGWIYTEQLIAGSMSYGGRGYPRDVASPHSDVIDHRECFVTWRGDGPRTPQSCRYPVAILSHTYGPWEPCVAYAHECGLNVERLPYSWYYPGQCIAALFTRREQP